MLLSMKHLRNYTVEAKDGNIGQVHDFLFDDQNWAVRYLVADIGKLLPGRKVLIAPQALGRPEPPMHLLSVKLARQQVKNSPDIDTEKPVSRQQEIELYKYYNWASYWGGTLGEIGVPYPPAETTEESQAERTQATGVKTKEQANPHLRSTKEVLRYKIHAVDGHIGHVDDFIVDTDDWIIRYMIVDTRDWLGGRRVVIGLDWIKEISWSMAKVTVDVNRETVKNSPEFDAAEPVNREYETRLYDYYGRPAYWR